MPRDVEIPSLRQDAPATPSADAGCGGDASILILLGVFAAVDALIVSLLTLT